MPRPSLCAKRMAIFTVLVVSFFLDCSLANKVQKQNRAVANDIKFRKAHCTTHHCKHLDQYENENCVNRCLSADCFDTVYASEPLEDGEIDSKREREFSACLRREVKQLLMAEKLKSWKGKKSQAGFSNSRDSTPEL